MLASLTLLPAMLAVLGERINRFPVMPRRLIDRGHPEDGAWGRWARFVLRRPVIVAAVGLAIVAVLAGLGTQLNATEAPLNNFPGAGTAIAGRDQLAAAGISPGVMKPLDVLVENGGDASGSRRGCAASRASSARPSSGRTARTRWSRRSRRSTAPRPASRRSSTLHRRARGTDATVTGLAAVDRDFLHALSGRLPYVLALVLLLTLILLGAGLPLDRAADQGRAAEPPLARRGLRRRRARLPAGPRLRALGRRGDQSVTAWVPVMIFAFLFGLSMDYEVFMLSRMREAYDETGSTDKAIELGLARTGKLVTSAAVILGFAFLVLSTSPGYEIKPLAIGLAAGIVLDATVIRALLVPAFMRLWATRTGGCPGARASAAAPRRPRARPSPRSARRQSGLRARLGATRGGLSGCLGYTGGHGASSRPSARSRS